jgi:hypothetical protein
MVETIKNKPSMMKDIYGFYGPGHLELMIKKTRKALMLAVLLFVITAPFFSSCSKRIYISGQNKNLPSAYTGTGKYVQKSRLGKSHGGIRKVSLKCPIPQARKK